MTVPWTALLGRQIAPFTLPDYRGKTHSLADYNDQSAIVVFFLGTECPLAKLYGARVQKLSEEYSPRGVAFLGVSSNVQDSLSFILAQPRQIPAGSVIHCTAHFDNSSGNLANPDPSKTVRWGPQTWEEMMIGWFDIGIPVQRAEEPRDKAKRG